VLLKNFLNYDLQDCRGIQKLVHLVRNKPVYVGNVLVLVK